MKLRRLPLYILIPFVVLYFIGPKPTSGRFEKTLPVLSTESKSLEEYILAKENKYQPLKPGNEAKIIWYDDSLKSKTKYSMVYLHGFSASHEEGNPVHVTTAKKYGMNLFLARYSGHGRDLEDQLFDFNVNDTWKDAKEALAIGKAIGDSVILMSTSTGGTLSLFLSSIYNEVAAQILMSPNIKINDPAAFLLNNHWGLHIARNVIGSDYRIAGDTSALYAKYWNARYRIESLVQLEELIESTMSKKTFSTITAPTLLMYYYQDEAHQDPVVRVDAMEKMFDQISTDKNLKVKVAIPKAGNHVIGSYIKSNDLPSVQNAIDEFIQGKLGLKVLN